MTSPHRKYVEFRILLGINMKFNIQNAVNALIADSEGLMITECCSCFMGKQKIHDFSKTFSEFTKFYDFSRISMTVGTLHITLVNTLCT